MVSSSFCDDRKSPLTADFFYTLDALEPNACDATELLEDRHIKIDV